jgi:hypothetical protein
MKVILGCLGGALVLALVGSAALSAARYERHMANAQQEAATGQYAEASASLTEAEGYLQYARWVPGVGDDAAREVAARRAALQYWQKEYDALVPAQAEPVAAVDEANVDLQLVVANAAFRSSPARAKDRESLVQALDEAASGYLTVLKNDQGNEDAAYNYEYAIRLRDEAAKGRRQPPVPQDQDGEMGESGAPADTTNSGEFKIYVPLQGNEKNPDGGEAGKSSPRDRKG